jgi:deazaflavin-dependent oxidoreductase (nitroreductase family)
MWFMNHVFNPIVRWMLTSPLHNWLSKDVLLIAFRGRKSGKEYVIPVQYARDGSIVWIVVGFPAQKRWWRNLVGGGAVRLCLQREWLSGDAVLYQGEAGRAGVMEGLGAMVKKYPNSKSTNYGLETPAFSAEGQVVIKVVLK